jgi:hypothetical protein
LNEDGKIEQYDYDNKGIMLLRKSSLDDKQHMLLVYNKDWEHANHIYIPDLHYYLPFDSHIFQLSVAGAQIFVTDRSLNRPLTPNEFILYVQTKQ